MTKERAGKIFPVYMKDIQLPEGAKEEEIEVYRVCLTGKVEPDSFLNSYEDAKLKIRDLDLNEVGSYSLSCYEDIKDIRKMLKFFTKRTPGVPVVAQGLTESCCGVVQRTIERIKLKSGKSHIDWWLYEDAKPHNYFKEVQNI